LLHGRVVCGCPQWTAWADEQVAAWSSMDRSCTVAATRSICCTSELSEQTTAGGNRPSQQLDGVAPVAIHAQARRGACERTSLPCCCEAGHRAEAPTGAAAYDTLFSESTQTSHIPRPCIPPPWPSPASAAEQALRHTRKLTEAAHSHVTRQGLTQNVPCGNTDGHQSH
jgi:hypothetical protein